MHASLGCKKLPYNPIYYLHEHIDFRNASPKGWHRKLSVSQLRCADGTCDSPDEALIAALLRSVLLFASKFPLITGFRQYDGVRIPLGVSASAETYVHPWIEYA